MWHLPKNKENRKRTTGTTDNHKNWTCKSIDYDRLG